MAGQELPNFNVVAASINNNSHEQAPLAVHLERVQNLPAFDAGAQILQAIAVLSRRMDEQIRQEISRSQVYFLIFEDPVTDIEGIQGMQQFCKAAQFFGQLFRYPALSFM